MHLPVPSTDDGHAVDDSRSKPPTERVIIGISGVPGAGKTTLAAAVCQRINATHPSLAVALPMDGFHYSRAHLVAMPNAAERTICAPSFAHEIKDPVADAIAIPPSARIVLIEGNYCALDRAPWRDAAKLMSRLLYVDASAEVTHARLAKRHLASGIVADEKEAWERASKTDEVNAKDIRGNLLKVDEVIPMS